MKGEAEGERERGERRGRWGGERGMEGREGRGREREGTGLSHPVSRETREDLCDEGCDED